VATFWAGIPAYFSDFRMVDMLGYTDPHVARLDSVWRLDRSSIDRYTPGHAKWDYDYVFESRRPDAFFQAWAVPDAVLSPKMAEHGFARYGDYWIRPEALVTDR
jgi:hypothetical protein